MLVHKENRKNLLEKTRSIIIKENKFQHECRQMFFSAYTRHIPDYGDPTMNQAESMKAAITKLIRKYFLEFVHCVYTC